MSADPVLRSFLAQAARDAAEINRDSEAVRLLPLPCVSGPPDTYVGVLSGVEHLERLVDGTVRQSAEDIPFQIRFPEDYCRSIDRSLQFRVLTVLKPLFHPNSYGRHVCLGEDFRPATRMRPLIEQVYFVLSSQVAAPEHALDARAARYWLRHVDEIRRLRARPLWHPPVASRVRVEVLGGAGEEG